MNNKNNNNVNTDTQQNRVDQSRNEIFRFSRISLEIDFAALLPGRAVLATRCRFQSAHRAARVHGGPAQHGRCSLVGPMFDLTGGSREPSSPPL